MLPFCSSTPMCQHAYPTLVLIITRLFKPTCSYLIHYLCKVYPSSLLQEHDGLFPFHTLDYFISCIWNVFFSPAKPSSISHSRTRVPQDVLDIFLTTCRCLVSVVISTVENSSHSQIRLISSQKISKLQVEVKQIK